MEELNNNNFKETGIINPLQEGLKVSELKTNDNISDWKRKIALFLSGQTVSLFGSALVQYAIIWYITLATQSGQMMTIATVCAFLPQIGISLFAGVWADRYNRKFLIISGDVLIALSTFILAVIFMLGFKELWLLFLISGIRSIGTGIQMPAVNALIPQIVPQEKLLKVNGINGSIQSLIMLISPAVSGALLSNSTIETIFFIDVATAVIAVFIMFILKTPIHRKALERQEAGYFDDLKAGLKYIRHNFFIRSLLIFNAVFLFLVTPAASLTPLMVTRSFGEEVWRLTFNEMVFFAGTIMGGIIIAAWGGFKKRIYTLAFACTAFGIFTAALGLSRFFIIYLIIMFAAGITMPFFSSPATALVQENVEQDMQGRVFSVVQIVGSIAFPSGMVVFGPAADIVKVELLLVITGILLTALGVSIFYNKGLKSVN